MIASTDEVREAEPGPGKKEGGRGKGREAELQNAFRQPGDRSPSCTRFYPPRVNRILTWQAPNEQLYALACRAAGFCLLCPVRILQFPAMTGESVIPGIFYALDSTASTPRLPLWSPQKRLSLDSSGF